MSSLIEARIYHLPKEVNDAARYCSDRLSTHPLYPPLTEFLSVCAQTDPVLGLALELRRPVANGSRLGIYVILPPGINQRELSAIDMVSKFHGALTRRIKALGIPLISHASFVYTSSGNVEAKLTLLETALNTNYRLDFIPMMVNR